MLDNEAENMSEENKKKLDEQLIRCVLDDKLSNDKKLRKMGYIVKLGADVNAECGLGYSVLSLAKMMQNDEVVSFLEERGANDIGFDKEKAEDFFKSASVEEINRALKVLPEGFELNCDVDLRKRDLTELPDFSRVVVNGNFNCGGNQLDSLEGAPREVAGDFYCSKNKLVNLEGAPVEVGGDFVCDINKLVNFEGAPVEVGGFFYCFDNPLKSYKGKPNKIGGNFYAPSIEQVNIINGGNVR